ncbi:MAG: hypothetical protein ACPL07_00825 [Candidatus Bathyarchaeia archaeon]
MVILKRSRRPEILLLPRGVSITTSFTFSILASKPSILGASINPEADLCIGTQFHPQPGP